jgi:capsid portal protein
MISTDDNEYLYSLRDLSAVSYTSSILENEIDHVLSSIGSKRFAAVVSDNASAIANAQKHISDKYLHILNIWCIVHFVNLITKDILGIFFFSFLIIYYLTKLNQFNFKILEYNFANKIVKQCNIISRFFKTSHMAGAILRKYIEDHNIEGGGLHIYIQTRWTSMYETTNSIVRLKELLEKVR